jgi:hypothetical protein
MRFKRRGLIGGLNMRAPSGSLIGIAVALVLLVLGGLVVFLATADLPPPSQPVEKVLPDSRFSR